jgi:hypothetical protein
MLLVERIEALFDRRARWPSSLSSPVRRKRRRQRSNEFSGVTLVNSCKPFFDAKKALRVRRDGAASRRALSPLRNLPVSTGYQQRCPPSRRTSAALIDTPSATTFD